jgi:hypothetical protein
MIDFNRTEEKQAAIGTTVFYVLLILLLFILSKSCTTAEAIDVDAGGVAISLGQPDQGGPDNSSAQAESTPPPSVPDYTPQSQVTADDEDAPEVQETKPAPKVTPKKTVTEPAKQPEETKPTETKPTKPAPKINIGNKSSGGGSGDASKNGGDKGAPDGTGNNPNGDGGKGTSGKGLGSGPTSGPVVGSIRGFDARITPPSGGVQDNGVVRLYVCVNASGSVTTVKHDPLRGAPGTTTNSGLINKAISSIQQSSFKNVSGSNGGCGHFTYTFKVN